MNFDDAAGYDALKTMLAEIDTKFGTQGNRLFYLATAPEYFSDIIKYPGRTLHGETGGLRRWRQLGPRDY